MTTETAIEIINGRIEFGKREYSDVAPEYIEALEMAIEALRKQEPMRPEADGEFGSCKRCWYVFDSELISEHCVKYCPYCGQAIDWSEE